MKRGIYGKCCKEGIYINKGPIKIVGISSGKRAEGDCAREDPVSLFYLKLCLREAERLGAQTELIDLRELKIGPCKECYSTCPAQCRFNETRFQCDCYPFKEDTFFITDENIVTIEKAYDLLSKRDFFRIYHDKGRFAERDDMWKVYKALIEADGIIFATATNFYGRPALLQTMLSRFCALDGGVEELWGDGKNLQNSIRYSKNPKAKYKQRLYGKFCAFINVSKEGDNVTPNLMKACVMMGMRVLPLGIAYRVNWYEDKTHRSDTTKAKNDPYTLSLVKHIAREMVKQIKKSDRKYGLWISTA
ncbi:MAG: NAD(P)H-dependent oxidoreductase [Candidatus Pacearchaeota archaeon]|nr:NAD(P)H-dependent oxidoreductase [Candidatus Pacearchaeota archaeon]